jgi:predicted nuclease with TOPRIM domain
MFQQSITEMEHLSHENMTLKDEIKYLNEQTFDMENELSQLKSINDRHQYNEVQYQRLSLILLITKCNGYL